MIRRQNSACQHLKATKELFSCKNETSFQIGFQSQIFHKTCLTCLKLFLKSKLSYLKYIILHISSRTDNSNETEKGMPILLKADESSSDIATISSLTYTKQKATNSSLYVLSSYTRAKYSDTLTPYAGEEMFQNLQKLRLFPS